MALLGWDGMGWWVGRPFQVGKLAEQKFFLNINLRNIIAVLNKQEKVFNDI